MERALRAAEDDAGASLLSRLDSIELIGLITWRYADPVSLLCERLGIRSEEHTSELQSLMRISYAVFCLKKKIIKTHLMNKISLLKIQNNSTQANAKIKSKTT